LKIELFEIIFGTFNKVELKIDIVKL
jgi:hypothetical protein